MSPQECGRQNVHRFVQTSGEGGKRVTADALADAAGSISTHRIRQQRFDVRVEVENTFWTGYAFAVWEADQKEQARVNQMLDDMAPKESIDSTDSAE